MQNELGKNTFSTLYTILYNFLGHGRRNDSENGATETENHDNIPVSQEPMLPSETEGGVSQNKSEGVNPKQWTLRALTAKMGTGRSKSTLQAAGRMAWFYVSKLDKAIIVEGLNTYIADNGVSAMKECEDLQWCKIKFSKLIYHPPNGKLSAMQPSGQKE